MYCIMRIRGIILRDGIVGIIDLLFNNLLDDPVVRIFRGTFDVR